MTGADPKPDWLVCPKCGGTNTTYQVMPKHLGDREPGWPYIVGCHDCKIKWNYRGS